MFERFLSFLKDIPAAEGTVTALAIDDPRIAGAALLFHVLDADGVRDAAEMERLRASLEKTYGLTGAELERLLRAGEAAEREAVDLYAFTSVLKRHLDIHGRKTFIGLMWDVVFADGALHELEDNLVWRVAELLGVDSRDRVAMRSAARAQSEGGA